MAKTDEVKTANALIGEMLENTRKMQKQLDTVKNQWKVVAERVTESRKGILGTIGDVVGLGPKVDRWMTHTHDYVKNLRAGSEQTAAAAKHLSGINIRPIERLSAAYLAFVTSMRNSMNETNGAIKEGNQLLENRYAILQKSLKAQVATGASTGTVNAAMKALVGYGMEQSAQYQTSLETVLKMNTALGLSVETGAQLAFLYDKMGKTTTTIADDISKIVDQTALAADEAARFATELGRAALFLPEGGKALDFKFLGMMEGYIKESRGIQGELTKFATDMLSTQQGSMNALIMGINPAQAGTTGGQQALVERLTDISKVAQQMRDQGNLIGSTMYLQAMSEAFTQGKLSPATILAMADAEKKRAEATESNLTLDERWRAELKDTGQVLGTLKNSTLALLKIGLLPTVKVINKVLSILTPVVEWLTKLADSSAVLKVTLGTLVPIAGVVTVMAIGRLTKSLIQLGLAATVAARQVQANAAAQMLGGGGGAIRGAVGAMQSPLALSQMSRFAQFRALATVPMTGNIARQLAGNGPAMMRVLRFMTSGPALAVISAGLGGWMAGRAIDKWFPGVANWMTFGMKRAVEQEAKTRTNLTDWDAAHSSAFGTRLMKMSQQGASMAEIQKYAQNAIALGRDPAEKARMALMVRDVMPAVARLHADVASAKVQTGQNVTASEVQQAELARQNIAVSEQIRDQVVNEAKESVKANRLRLKQQEMVEQRDVERRLNTPYRMNLQPQAIVGY